MAIIEVADASTQALGALVADIGKIGLWIQALGIVIILWIAFQIISLVNGRIRRKRLYTMNEKLESMDKKLNRLLKKK
jgi:hypothetical protein